MRRYITTILTAIFLITLTAVACKSNNTKVKEAALNAPASQPFKDSLPQPVGYINDFDSLFSKTEIRELEKLLSDFENKTTIQIAVVTFDTLMTNADNLYATTLKLANDWGVGRKDKNNGVLVGICKECRKMAIQNGSGIEKGLSDQETENIIATGFIDSFMKGNFYEGTLAGLNTLIEALEEKIKLKLID